MWPSLAVDFSSLSSAFSVHSPLKAFAALRVLALSHGDAVCTRLAMCRSHPHSMTACDVSDCDVWRCQELLPVADDHIML
eukprot:3908443-Amphidinium_carterae.1